MSIETVGLTHVYMAGTPRAITAVESVDLRISDGETVGIVGPTGSGKSTLVQHFNGLLRPTSGRVLVDGEDLWPSSTPPVRGDRVGQTGEAARAPRPDLRKVRQKVGLIFQLPEHQLFEETVYDDVAFGPRNLGLSGTELDERVTTALEMVGISGAEAEVLRRRSPFSLSGGQMRRVAIAGVLAMRPATLVLDEPTAGLDPRGRRGLLDTLTRLHRKWGLTLVVVSHNMEDLARLVSRIVVMSRGRVVADSPVRDVFQDIAGLRELGLDVPAATALMAELARHGARVGTDVLDPAEAAEEIDRWLRARRPTREDQARGAETGGGQTPETAQARGEAAGPCSET